MDRPDALAVLLDPIAPGAVPALETSAPRGAVGFDALSHTDLERLTETIGADVLDEVWRRTERERVQAEREEAAALAAGTEASAEDLATAQGLMDTVGRTAVGLLGPHAAAPERQVSDQADEQSGENAQVRARPGRYPCHDSQEAAELTTSPQPTTEPTATRPIASQLTEP